SGALRALQLWHKQVGNLQAILQTAVRDKHPQVRLEAVIALRNIDQAAVAKTALDVLEQPMDEFLDFALWQTMRQLEPKWMDALKSAASTEAITRLTKLYKNRQVPDQYKKDVLSAIATRGQVEDLNDILDVAVSRFSQQENVSEELTTVADAASERKVTANRQP